MGLKPSSEKLMYEIVEAIFANCDSFRNVYIFI